MFVAEARMNKNQPRFPVGENELRERTGRTGSGGIGSVAESAQDLHALTPSKGIAQRERGLDGAEVVAQDFVVEQYEIDLWGKGKIPIERNGERRRELVEETGLRGGIAACVEVDVAFVGEIEVPTLIDVVGIETAPERNFDFEV